MHVALSTVSTLIFQLDSGCCGCDTVALWDGTDSLLAELSGCDDPSGLMFRAYSGEMKVRFYANGNNVEDDPRGFSATITRG